MRLLHLSKLSDLSEIVHNVKNGGWAFLSFLLIALPILGYAFHDKHERLEKCKVKWEFEEETGSVKIDVTGSKVKDAVIDFNLKQNCSKNNL